jgi:hypothetical protein
MRRNDIGTVRGITSSSVGMGQAAGSPVAGFAPGKSNGGRAPDMGPRWLGGPTGPMPMPTAGTSRVDPVKGGTKGKP